MATPQSIRQTPRPRDYVPSVSVVAAHATGALHLAIRGMRSADSELTPAQLESLEWLAEFANDATEATMALANELPARWKVFYDQADTLEALGKIPETLA